MLDGNSDDRKGILTQQEEQAYPNSDNRSDKGNDLTHRNGFLAGGFSGLSVYNELIYFFFKGIARYPNR